MAGRVRRSKMKRWGPKCADTRNWPTYNAQLVKRGQFFLDLRWVEGWQEELERMNEGKTGRPYQFPDSLIRLQGFWHAMRIPYRMIMGITKQLHEMADLPAYNHYSTTNRRINQLDIEIDLPMGEDITVFADGTGFQAVVGGEYLRSKYGKKNRRWVQVTILGDPETKEPVSFEVSLIPGSEADSAERQLDALMDEGVNIRSFGGDGGYDKISLWQYWERERIRPIIKPDRNARVDSDSDWRNRHTRYRNDQGYRSWVKVTGYGKRWPATEGIFSAIKRTFGENLAATRQKGLIQEARLKVWAYTTMKRYGEA